jgi:hypothetical protein
MKKEYTTLLIAILIGFNISLKSQNLETDKCGLEFASETQNRSMLSSNNWGYGYADLETDLEKWGQHDFINIDFIGKSVQGRKLYVLNIKDESKESSEFRVSIHARTHPNEVQAWYVTNEIINILLSETTLSNRLLNKVVFSVIPMINPDGVELNSKRKNANGVDIESNWGKTNPEPEVAALKAFFGDLMKSELPIDVMLNMHSAYACKRYFVYHRENGTSYSYTQDEKRFINGVQSYFEEGIEDWNYYVSWTNGTPTRYPESWFWNNYTDRVMALTYEDGNCDSAGSYDVTAFALLSGIADYLKLESLGIDEFQTNRNTLNIYPNPVSTSEKVYISAHTYRDVEYTIQLISFDGSVFEIPMANTTKSGSIIELNLDIIPSGMYLVQYSSEGISTSGKLIIR